MKTIIGVDGWSVKIRSYKNSECVDITIYHNGELKEAEICVLYSNNYAKQINDPNKYLTHLM